MLGWYRKVTIIDDEVKMVLARGNRACLPARPTDLWCLYLRGHF
jgi:hypothetical protein